MRVISPYQAGTPSLHAMTHPNWSCPKCANREFDVDRIRTSGGALSAIFDVENKKFETVTCGRCRYTELYRTSGSTLAQVLDLFTT